MRSVGTRGSARRFEVYTSRTLERIPHLKRLDPERRAQMARVAKVLPFRVNRYVLDHLIDWDEPLEDPMFRLVLPQPEMLLPEHREMLVAAEKSGDRARIEAVVREIRSALNPHPAGQLDLNRPCLRNGKRLLGIQHKYHETVLYFPASGQTCHSYCSFCFRWPQFVGERAWRMASASPEDLFQYLREHPEVSDVLITGGDPLVMKAAALARIIRPLLAPEFAHVRNIRIGTKALTYWPFRFLDDPDAEDLLRLFEEVRAHGRHLALMAHINHPRELSPQPTRRAIRRVQEAGGVIRSQSPLLRHINDRPEIWSRMWKEQVQLGIVPYYMFVERDTGARHYFEVPLVRAWEIYREAFQCVSGLARTVRGPSMSATPGKVEVQGVARIGGEKVFVLRFLQARNPAWVERPFFAAFDPKATWLDQLRPAFGEPRFFFEGADAR